MKKNIQYIQTQTAGLPAWAKGVIAVAVVGGVVYFLYKFKDIIKKITEGKESQNVVDDAKNEVKELSKQYTLSKPKSAYSSCIGNIVKLLSDCESVSSEMDVVENIIRVVKNPLDWAYLVAEFNKKSIPDCGTGSTVYSLPELLKDQLDTFGCYAPSKTVDGYKLSGCRQNTIDFLNEYLATKKITI